MISGWYLVVGSDVGSQHNQWRPKHYEEPWQVDHERQSPHEERPKIHEERLKLREERFLKQKNEVLNSGGLLSG